MGTHQSLNHNILTKNYVRNVDFVVKNRLCIGCGICKVACSKFAIQLVPDESLGFRPVVNEARCNGCRKCLQVCYGYCVDNAASCKLNKPIHAFLGNVVNCYVGYAADKNLRFNATSGGVIPAILNYALTQGLIDGAIVTRMEAGNPPKAKAFIATTTDEILQSIGSKYCPVSFSECLNEVEFDKKYAFVGLPCHIYALRKLAKINRKMRNAISFFLGILCGGMPDLYGTRYILRRYDLEGKFLEKLEYRGGGWPGRLLVRTKEEKGKKVEVQVPYPQYWNDTFGFFIPYRCMLCNDGYNWFSDASFGDAWLPEIRLSDDQGSSLIITRTLRGETLVSDAFKNGVIQISPIKIEDVIRAQEGLVHFKFSTIRARLDLYKKFGRKMPLVDFSNNPPAKFGDYLQGIWLFFGDFLAHKKRFWQLFDVYVTINSFLNAAKFELEKVKQKISSFR